MRIPARSLTHCDIGDEGAKAIAKALATHQSLTELECAGRPVPTPTTLDLVVNGACARPRWQPQV